MAGYSPSSIPLGYPESSTLHYPLGSPPRPEATLFPFSAYARPPSQSSLSSDVIKKVEKTIDIAGINYIYCKTFQNGRHLRNNDCLFVVIKTVDHLYTLTQRKLVYEGETMEGLPHGYGIYINYNGQRPVGLFSHADIVATGHIPNRIGSIYRGIFSCGAAHGHGETELSIEHSYKYVGQFKNGIEHGAGKEIVSGQVVFDGHYLNGFRHGQATCILKDVKYTGNFVNGVKHGYGIEIDKDKSMYKGFFINGLRHGNGALHGTDGSIYEGEFKNGNKFRGTTTKP